MARCYIERSYHLPICRDCNELCYTMFLTSAEYDEWRSKHEQMGHTIELGPEVPFSPYRNF